MRGARDEQTTEGQQGRRSNAKSYRMGAYLIDDSGHWYVFEEVRDSPEEPPRPAIIGGFTTRVSDDVLCLGPRNTEAFRRNHIWTAADMDEVLAGLPKWTQTRWAVRTPDYEEPRVYDCETGEEVTDIDAVPGLRATLDETGVLKPRWWD